MNHRTLRSATLSFLLAALPATHGAGTDEVLAGYRQAGAAEPSAARGAAMWTQGFADPQSGKEQSCASCHNADLRRAGKHTKTGKPIDPMAPSVNPKRLTDPQFVEKWLKRNCKGVLGRECSPQEKADLVVFIRGQ